MEVRVQPRHERSWIFDHETRKEDYDRDRDERKNREEYAEVRIWRIDVAA